MNSHFAAWVGMLFISGVMAAKEPVISTGKSSATSDETILSQTEFDSLHQKARNRPRRIIFNNDGVEPVRRCKTTSPEELLSYRTSPLAGTQVDSIFYCSLSSGFGTFTHFTKVGEVFTATNGFFANNRMPDFVRDGVDPLRVMNGFARSNGIEFFWSMRMNDTHDASSQEYGPPKLAASKLKNAHPEYLIGTKENRPRFGAWTAVDYGRPEIRDLAFRYCEEVASNYDVNGIELDFFRPHQDFFNTSVLDPSRPVIITNRPAQIRMFIGEPDSKAKATLKLQFKQPPRLAKLDFQFNGHALKTNRTDEAQVELELPAGILRRGENGLVIAPSEIETNKVVLADLLVVVE